MAQVNIEKRGNVYQYRFEIAPQGGKRKFINKSGFKTKSEAQEAGNIAYTEYINAGVPFKECKLSYSDYLDYWLDNYCKSNLKYNTICKYRTIIDKYIRPKLGLYRLSTLTSVRLNMFITEICDEYSFSRSYFKNILKVVKGTFRDACNLYGFIKYNPALTLRLPKMDIDKKDPKHLYTQEEIDKILFRFRYNDTFTCSFLTSCYTGMRTGEVFALTWDDIDLDEGIISIKHSIYDKAKDIKGRWYLGSTKTISGERLIYISPTLLSALKNYKAKQDYLKQLYGNKYIYYYLEDVKNQYGKVIEKRIVQKTDETKDQITLNLVFTKSDGKFTGTDITKYPFEIIHKELGIEKCRFYDLRGSYATKVLNSGVEIRDVADMLGHRNIETTENYYVSSTDTSRKCATDNFDKMIQSEVINEISEYLVF